MGRSRQKYDADSRKKQQSKSFKKETGSKRRPTKAVTETQLIDPRVLTKSVSNNNRRHDPSLKDDDDGLPGHDACNQLIIGENTQVADGGTSRRQQLANRKKGKETADGKRLLSKKKRKQLEKVLEQKKKKLDRNELFAALQTVQLPDSELGSFVSIAQIQTKGVRKHKRELHLEAMGLDGSLRKRKQRKRDNSSGEDDDESGNESHGEQATPSSAYDNFDISQYMNGNSVVAATTQDNVIVSTKPVSSIAGGNKLKRKAGMLNWGDGAGGGAGGGQQKKGGGVRDPNVVGLDEVSSSDSEEEDAKLSASNGQDDAANKVDESNELLLKESDVIESKLDEGERVVQKTSQSKPVESHLQVDSGKSDEVSSHNDESALTDDVAVVGRNAAEEVTAVGIDGWSVTDIGDSHHGEQGLDSLFAATNDWSDTSLCVAANSAKKKRKRKSSCGFVVTDFSADGREKCAAAGSDAKKQPKPAVAVISTTALISSNHATAEGDKRSNHVPPAENNISSDRSNLNVEEITIDSESDEDGGDVVVSPPREPRPPLSNKKEVEVVESKPSIELIGDSERSSATTKVSQAEQTRDGNQATTETSRPPPPSVDRKRACFVSVNRTAAIQACRMLLPIIGEEQSIMEAIHENDVVVICGETGSGKTTQVPQFLYEAGYAQGFQIGITEPRRVAAMAMSRRVAEEMNLGQDVVSYQIRFEGNVTERTKIKFMTDGVLLKELQKDFLLTKYRVIVIDEAHERSMYSDILLGLLSRIVPLRRKRNNPLKLIVMSATLKVDDFTDNQRLFRTPPPLLKVESRQYPVSIHFNRSTNSDYLGECFRKVCKIHTSENPSGAILVFLTGQREVNVLCRKLRRMFPAAFGHAHANNKGGAQNKSASGDKILVAGGESEDDEEAAENEDIDREIERLIDARSLKMERSGGISALKNDKRSKNKKKKKVDALSTSASASSVTGGVGGVASLPDIRLDAYPVDPIRDDTEGDLADVDGVDNDENASEKSEGEDDDDAEEDDGVLSQLKSKLNSDKPLWVLPLYSLLSKDKQDKVFQAAPEGHRLCVVATNIAETSLTIPGVKYVVDSGKVKRKIYDKLTGVSTFAVDWTSKASADQRAGRAGRVGPGHCYRLYSSAVFTDSFAAFSPVEMQERPVEEVMLQMKSLGITRAINFPFPSPPDEVQLRVAETQLYLLGALQEERIKGKRPKDKDELLYPISSLGRAMSSIPVSPRFAKMLCLAGGQMIEHAEGTATAPNNVQTNQQPPSSDLLAYTIATVAALSVSQLLLESQQSDKEDGADVGGGGGGGDQWMRLRRQWAGAGNMLSLGDPGVLLHAMGAAEFQLSSHKIGITSSTFEHFCSVRLGIRHKAFVEARKLRCQLTNELKMLLPGTAADGLTLEPMMKPPDEMQAKLLRQLLLAGFVDQVALRVDPSEIKEQEDRIKWKNAYRCPHLEEPVFLYQSCVLRSQRPKWILYNEIFEGANQRMYLRGITEIEPEWLAQFAPSLCNLSPPLTDPLPSFDQVKGQVMCHVSATYGRSAFPIGRLLVPYPDADNSVDKYRHFARFLLDGKVFPKLSSYVDALLSPPDTMIKSWARLQSRTTVLLEALVRHSICDRQSLQSKWSTDKKYLLREYQMWIPEALHVQVSSAWPPIE